MLNEFELESKIEVLCTEANAMLLANLLESKRATYLRRRILECADQARAARLAAGEQKLLQAADELEARFPPPIA